MKFLKNQNFTEDGISRKIKQNPVFNLLTTKCVLVNLTAQHSTEQSVKHG